jgi:DNA-binding response OmpR family regulator
MQKKILIVDNEKDIVDLIAYNLEKEGFATLNAYDGNAALDIAKTKKPDLVILDLMLPGSDKHCLTALIWGVCISE